MTPAHNKETGIRTIHQEWNNFKKTFKQIKWAIGTFRTFKSSGPTELFPALLQMGGEETTVKIRRKFAWRHIGGKMDKWCRDVNLNINLKKSLVVVFTRWKNKVKPRNLSYYTIKIQTDSRMPKCTKECSSPPGHVRIESNKRQRTGHRRNGNTYGLTIRPFYSISLKTMKSRLNEWQEEKESSGTTLE